MSPELQRLIRRVLWHAGETAPECIPDLCTKEEPCVHCTVAQANALMAQEAGSE
jgi:hypothetical protein